MTGPARLRSWLRAIAGRPRLNREIREELESLTDQHAEDLQRQGVPAAEARRRARAALGSLDARCEDCRESIGLRLFDELSGDVRYALRTLRRAPSFSIVAILTIAVGIGANAAILSLMEAAVWRPLPVRDPSRLRLLTWASGPNDVMDNTTGPTVTAPDGTRAETPFSYAVFTALRRRTEILTDLCAFRALGRVTAVIDGQAETATAQLVSGNHDRALGISAALGRSILESDDAPGMEVVAVISNGFWTRRFDRQPSVIGRRIDINGAPVTIVGVAPIGFSGATLGLAADVSLPLHAQPSIAPNRYLRTASMLDDPATWWLSLLGRLSPAVGDAQAQSALELALQDAVRASLPDRTRLDQPHLRMLDGSRGVDALGEEFGRPVRVLLGFVGFVLLLICANLGSLLLARASARQREISLRLAIGASRVRLVRQTLTEGLVLAGIGGSLGLLVGYATRNVIPSLLVPSWVPMPMPPMFDARVLAGAVGLTLLAGVLFSLAPAWHFTRSPLGHALRDAGRVTRSTKMTGARPLVVLQVVLSAVLLAGAGLFLRTLTNLYRADLGFRPDRIVLLAVDPPRSQYAGRKRVALFERTEESLRVLPGVQHLSLSASPLVGHDTNTTSVGVDGRRPRRGAVDSAWINQVGNDFFQTMNIPILQGRGFEQPDGRDAPPVAVVNQAFVQKFFPSGEALGHTVTTNGVTSRIVGIAGDTRYRDIRTPPPPTIFRPYVQLDDADSMTFEIQTELPEAAVARAAREALRAIDPQIPVGDVRSQRAQIDSTLSQERLFAVLTGTFSLVAIALTCIGIYGVVANAVGRRTNEIGIRVALGATRRNVIAMVLGEIVLPVGLGAGLGILAIAGVGRVLSTLLYGVAPQDPSTIAGALLLVLATALVAAAIPARRATRIDPMEALRAD